MKTRRILIALAASALASMAMQSWAQIFDSPSQPSPPSGGQTPTTGTAPPNPQPGSRPSSAHTPVDISLPGLLLEVYLIEGDKYPEKPAGISLATFDDERTPSFGYGAVLENRELAPYRDRRLGLRWSGSFRITENGRHVFSFVNTDGARCRVVLTLGGEQLFNDMGLFHANTTPFNQEIILEQKVYPFDCWMVCNQLNASMQLRMRGPRDRTISLVPSDRFSHPDR
jgi:hypothetical protein